MLNIKHILPSSVPVGKFSFSQAELRLALLSLYTHPPTPDKYIWATFRPPWMLTFGMEALFNRTRSTSQLSSPQLVSKNAVASYDIFCFGHISAILSRMLM